MPRFPYMEVYILWQFCSSFIVKLFPETSRVYLLDRWALYSLLSHLIYNFGRAVGKQVTVSENFLGNVALLNEFILGFVRCDLVISSNGKEEKIASGLVNPFLAHLKTAQEQMAKGGYSIVLEPEHGSDDTWFTKDTIERCVL